MKFGKIDWNVADERLVEKRACIFNFWQNLLNVRIAQFEIYVLEILRQFFLLFFQIDIWIFDVYDLVILVYYNYVFSLIEINLTTFIFFLWVKFVLHLVQNFHFKRYIIQIWIILFSIKIIFDLIYRINTWHIIFNWYSLKLIFHLILL